MKTNINNIKYKVNLEKIKTCIPNANVFLRSLLSLWSAPYMLDRKFNPGAPNQVWESDTTFIRNKEGWVHLCAVIDLFSRKVIGWTLDKKNNSELVEVALKEALFRRGNPKRVVFHSDRG